MSEAPVGAVAPARAKGARPSVLITAATIALIGTLFATLPFARWWFAACEERGEIVRYAAAVDQVREDGLAQMLRDADDYNAALARGAGGGPVGDPFADPLGELGAGGDGGDRVDAAGAGAAGAVDRYVRQLAVDGTGVMATVSVPAIGVVLPVYHGTSDATMLKGVGHLFGSSLPVGGPGTHSVLVGHSGHGESRLFHSLSKVAAGDVFSVSAAGRHLYYRVTGSEVVEPDAVESLDLVPGRDLVTLVTCTPIGINSHRLLVHAERTDAPARVPELAEQGARPFPWWAVADVVALAVWGGYVGRVVGRGRRSVVPTTPGRL